ncbi:sensory transduction protein [Clostridium tetanomorphum DSM 665]|nr:sensory transduction protein [Clostridium tetanomorphum DSM 665]
MGIIYDNYELDILSNFYNVDYSLENFKNLFYKSLYGYNSLSIIPVRISSLKHYNYVLGYEYGDMILKVVMERIRHIIKGYGHVHKFGGDTLLIILHEKCKDKVTHIIEKIINDFNELVKIKEKKIRIFFNIGIVRYPEDSKEINT